MVKRLLVLAATGIALVAAGCGGGGGSSSSTPSSAAPASSPAPATSTPSAGGAKVVMKNIQFSPKTLTVSKGTTVTWTNDDSVNHDVTKMSGPGPNFKSGSGNLGSGATYKVTFNTPGTIKYRCTIHPGMEGTIVVK